MKDDMRENLQRLLEWDNQAKRIVAEATAHVKGVRDGAGQRRNERLAKAKQEAADAGAQRRQDLLAQVEDQCRALRAEADVEAGRIREDASPRAGAAVQAALDWLLGQGAGHGGGR